jgi:hypothetical protein
MMQVQRTSDVPLERMLQWCDGTYVQSGILNAFNLFPNEILMKKTCMILPNELFKIEKTSMNHEKIRS